MTTGNATHARGLLPQRTKVSKSITHPQDHPQPRLRSHNVGNTCATATAIPAAISPAPAQYRHPGASPRRRFLHPSHTHTKKSTPAVPSKYKCVFASNAVSPPNTSGYSFRRSQSAANPNKTGVTST